MIARQWRVRLGAVAELDFANILKWTTENFGARGRPRSIGIRWCGPSANSPTAPMWPDQKRATRSCRACVRSMLPGAVGADVTSCYIAPSKGGSLKSAESYMTRWTCSVTCRFYRTGATMRVRRSSRQRHAQELPNYGDTITVTGTHFAFSDFMLSGLYGASCPHCRSWIAASSHAAWHRRVEKWGNKCLSP